MTQLTRCIVYDLALDCYTVTDYRARVRWSIGGHHARQDKGLLAWLTPSWRWPSGKWA